MKTKQTAVEWLKDQIIDNPDIYIKGNTLMIPNDIFRKAKQMEKEQMIEFANKVLDNTVGDYDGDIELLKPLEDIYNETYNVKDN
jgi:hypothetical protein